MELFGAILSIVFVTFAIMQLVWKAFIADKNKSITWKRDFNYSVALAFFGAIVSIFNPFMLVATILTLVNAYFVNTDNIPRALAREQRDEERAIAEAMRTIEQFDKRYKDLEKF